MKRANLFLLILCYILLNHVANAALTATTTIANCNQQGSISLNSTFGAVVSFSYSGTSSGTVTGSAVNLNCGTYSVTATLNNGATETASNIIVDHEDHIQLKNWYLTGNIPSIYVNWGTTINNPLMTDWDGITATNGCITEIDLTFNSITGAIPNFNLPNLTTLYLYGNGFSGTIPNFTNLPNLESLDLFYNQLSGTVPNFANLPNLVSLDLGNNQLSGTVPNFANLPNLVALGLGNNQLSGTIPNFTNLPNLGYLDLGYNQLSGTIPNFTNLPNLGYLDLGLNQLSGTIPNFANLPNLTNLDLAVNQISGTILNFTNLPKLEWLDLGSNKFSGTIPNFNNLPNLLFLYLGNNQLSGTIPDFINLPKLKKLYLSNNQLSGTIPNFNLPNLNDLYLNGNQINGAIPNFNLPYLVFLDLSYNQLSSTIPNFNLPYLIELILSRNQLNGIIPNFNLPYLEKIYLFNNQLTGTIPNFNLPYLKELYLSNNQLSGTIPNFNNLPKLKKLFLNNNQLSGCIPIGIKTQCPLIGATGGNIGYNSNLIAQTWANYWNNGLGACIPCSMLITTIAASGYKLSAVYNALNPTFLWSTGSDNSSINVNKSGVYSITITESGGCSATSNIQLSVPVECTINEAKCGTQGKIEFDNSANNIISYAFVGTNTGNGLGNNINLSQGTYSITLTLNNGSTTAISDVEIESAEHQFLKNWYQKNIGVVWNVNWGTTINNPAMTGWTGITTNANGCISDINLIGKEIKGNLPNFNLPNLTNLWLSNNQLSGNLPNFNLPNLQRLYLNGNQLSGSIPNFNFTNLQELYLDNNQLNGSIPNFNFTNLTTLYLNNNQLSGNLPNFNLPNLRILYLYNNQLSGNLPNFNLPNLITLFLYNNQLSGSIPIFNLPKLQILLLQNNQLSGSIPIFNLPNIVTLNLGNNQLSGSVPKLNLSKLRYLSLQNNQLSGCIPLEIKYNNPLIGSTGGSVLNNPSLNTQSWSDYWNSNTGTCPAAIFNGKVFLNSVNSTTGLMDDYLKTLQSFPTTDPYSYHPLDTVFKHVNNPIVAQVPTSTLSVTGNNSIIDWVFLELRNGTSGSTSVAYTKSALLQKDGDIVGMDGTSPVVFDNATPGNYYVTVRHRNHLGFRTANPIALSLTPTTLNFTNNSVPLYGATPLTALSPTLFAMNGGDANFDGSIDAFDTIKWELQNGLFDEYTNNADYNLDGSVDAFDSILWELNNGKYQELD